jgi:hypothetical protein
MGFIVSVSDAVIGVLSPGSDRKLIPLKYHVNAAKTVQTSVCGRFNSAPDQVVLERSFLWTKVTAPGEGAVTEMVFTPEGLTRVEFFLNKFGITTNSAFQKSIRAGQQMMDRGKSHPAPKVRRRMVAG